jgi:hypothetical protein
VGQQITVDTGTGEVLDEQVRPFAELLTVLDHGAAHAEASRQLHDLVAAVRDQGKKGTMTIALQVAPLKGSTSQVVVAAQVTSKPPKSEPAAAVFFLDDDGNLSRNDPRQLEMDGLRVVEPKPAKTVTV